jgi:Zn-dependent protease
MDFSLIPTLVILIVSIMLHEVAHGVAAYLHKDMTAYYAGRLTLNPIPHIDLFGSIILPALSLFAGGYALGWAKPVPYNPRNLVGKYAEFWVSAAGVLTNFCITLLAFIVCKVAIGAGYQSENLIGICFSILWTNLSLGLFNLIPIPPFDGMSIVQSLFPRIRISSSIIYNPMYMILAIIVAGTLFSAASPFIQRVLISLLYL